MSKNTLKHRLFIFVLLLWFTASPAHSFLQNRKFKIDLCHHALSTNVWNLLERLKLDYPDGSLRGQEIYLKSDLAWYELKNKKVRKLLQHKVNDFNSNVQIDSFLQELSFALYPSSFIKNHIEGINPYMVSEAKRVLLKRGLANYIKNSELSLKEKNNFLGRVRLTLTWLTRLLPWNYGNLIYKEMTPEVAESIIMDGIETIDSSNLPTRNFYIEKASTYSITLTLLASLTLAYSTYHEANLRMNQAIDGLESSLSTLEKTLQDENKALEDRLVDAYIAEFEKQYHHSPTLEQKEEIRSGVHQKFFDSPQPIGEEEQQ